MSYIIIRGSTATPHLDSVIDGACCECGVPSFVHIESGHEMRVRFKTTETASPLQIPDTHCSVVSSRYQVLAIGMEKHLRDPIIMALEGPHESPAVHIPEHNQAVSSSRC